MNKIFLRNKYKNIRKSIKFKYIKDLIIFFKVIKNKNVKSSDKLLIYVSKKEEVNTINLIKYYLGKKEIYVPKIVDDVMVFYEINSIKDLKSGYYNILEPVTDKKIEDYSSSCIIVPGICFDKCGYRVGYGKGFYDRFLSSNNIYSIGVCYKECLVNKIDNDKYDISVDEVINND